MLASQVTSQVSAYYIWGEPRYVPAFLDSWWSLPVLARSHRAGESSYWLILMHEVKMSCVKINLCWAFSSKQPVLQRPRGGVSPSQGRWNYKTVCSFLCTVWSMPPKRHLKSMLLLNSKQTHHIGFQGQDWSLKRRLVCVAYFVAGQRLYFKSWDSTHSSTRRHPDRSHLV